MINVVHTKQGKSFMGLVAYLLEGEKGAENPDRVAWTQTRNVPNRPKLAARVMAATALDQARLKQNAGVPNRGRKSSNHVLHFTLSPAAELGRKLTHDEWSAAIDGALGALGEKAGQKGGRNGKRGRTAVRDQFASEHQVLVVAHKDTDEPHVHIVVNRVHPEHGVMLPSSDDFLKLSRWAQKFQHEHGDSSTPQREINNEARDKGQKVYADKRKARDVYELEQDARDNHPEALKVQKGQGNKDAALARQSAETRTRCRQEWKTLETTHRQRLRELEEATAKEINTETRAIQVAFAERWKELHHRQRSDVETFEKRENTLIGQASNALKQLASLKSPVNVLWSQGARAEAFRQKQRREKLGVDRAERKAKRETKARIQRHQRAKKVQIGLRYQLDRAETILRHQMEKAAIRSAWKTRVTDRTRAWEEHHQRMDRRPPEQSHGRQTTVADERTRELIKSHEKLLERRAAKDNENERDGRGDRGR